MYYIVINWNLNLNLKLRQDAHEVLVLAFINVSMLLFCCLPVSNLAHKRVTFLLREIHNVLTLLADNVCCLLCLLESLIN